MQTYKHAIIQPYKHINTVHSLSFCLASPSLNRHSLPDNLSRSILSNYTERKYYFMHSVASIHGNGFWLLGCRSFFEPLEMSQKWLST